MNYSCGKEVMLGDVIKVEYGANKCAKARVVAIGLKKAHKDIDGKYYRWAKREKVIDENTAVVEWIGNNPLAHNNPRYAPVGQYMTIRIHSEELLEREKSVPPVRHGAKE